MKKTKVKRPVGRPLSFDEPLKSKAFTIHQSQIEFMSHLVCAGYYHSMSDAVREALDDLKNKHQKKGKI